MVCGLALALLGSCTGQVGDVPLRARGQAAELIEAQLSFDAAAGFSDERGDALFVDSEGKAVRLRSDGTLAPLQSHPGNRQAPGMSRALYGVGPFSALVAAENGVYLAESGWLIQPTWSDSVAPQGVRSSALGTDGVAWIAHENGLFRVQNGQLLELTTSAGPIKQVSALATAYAPDGSPAVWFVQDSKLKYAKQTTRTRFEVLEDVVVGKLEEELLTMASLSATPSEPSEVWLLTKQGLRRRTPSGLSEHALPGTPQALLGAGRFLWLSAGDELYRYDADQHEWVHLLGDEGKLTLLAADPSGIAWVRTSDGRTAQLRLGPVPRISGLFEGARVVDSELSLRARFSVDEAPDSVSFSLDDKASSTQTREQAVEVTGSRPGIEFALGGFDAAQREQTFSLAGLMSGLHTLTVRAKYSDREITRQVHFDYRPINGDKVSFADDVLPIFQARCAKCHEGGPARELSSYEQWVAEKERILSAVVELRMPADGPLDPAQVEILQRWAAGGSAP